ncbi:TetR family transcriptional regulator [Streptomyces sp. NPDC050636]|uniref:TetR family transcriptional regulator n=1 Tax=Streptomyces sp. NPDC050636 TaxID=3154510 RepID=UPI00343FFEAF
MDNTEHSGRQQTATERRRRELLEAAERIVLRDGPEASMNAIAAEAGITKPILYRHFGDKGGLYRALAVRHTDALLDNLRVALDAPVLRRDRVEATLDAYLVAIETRPQVYRFLMHPAEQGNHDNTDNADNAVESGFDVGRHSAPLLRRLGEELAKVIADRLDLGPGGEERARVWGHGIVGMMHAAGDWWLRERPCSREQLVQHLTDLLWGQLATVKDLASGPGF